MNAKRWMESVGVALFGALVLYAGWRGSWLPLWLTLGVLALRWLWRHVPLLLVGMAFWPRDDR